MIKALTLEGNSLIQDNEAEWMWMVHERWRKVTWLKIAWSYNSPPGPPHHSMQNKELSHPKKKMDINVDYDQLSAGLASGPSPKFLAPAV